MRDYRNAWRLAQGGRIDRAQPFSFTFDGKAIAAYAGDTVASALLANGFAMVARSFKYHRPRGMMGHGAEEPSALVTIHRDERDQGGRVTPNTRATVVAALPGLRVQAQNCWPNLDYDVGGIADWVAPLFPAGFYYKTFLWPQGWWHSVYEPIIRRAAGLGAPPREPDPDRYAQRHAHAELLVVGAGPAGLAATLAASADPGCRVILADEQLELGGSLLHRPEAVIAGRPAWDWLAGALAILAARPNVTLLPRTTVFGAYNHGHYGLAERLSDHLPLDQARGQVRERLWQVRAQRMVLASGAHERPLAFPENDRPGILLAESLRVYIARYGVLPGRRIVVVSSADSAWSAALVAAAAGASVTIVEARSADAVAPLAARAKTAGIDVLCSHTVLQTSGRDRITSIMVAPAKREERGDVGFGAGRVLNCDLLAMSGGWTPAVHLFAQMRGRLAYDAERDLFLPDTSLEAHHAAGAAAGVFDLAGCLASGWRAGGGDPAWIPVVEDPGEPGGAEATLFAAIRALPQPAGRGGRAFVDFQNDVTTKDLKLAVAEGFQSIEHVKRYTTTGMATDQGKTSAMNALGLVADLLERPVPAVGTTTYRPPYTPVTFATLVGPATGALFDPIRVTPTHDWAEAHGAVFEPVAQWRRAQAFPRAGESVAQATARECLAVRRAVGLFDASTLGKIQVTGRDARAFLNRVYAGNLSRLAAGRARYQLMLKEDGYVMDDGLVACLAEDRFLLTTTTAGAQRVLIHLEDYLQTEFTDLSVHLTSVTEQRAVLALQGPRAEATLAALAPEVDLSLSARPLMSVTEVHLLDVPVQLWRVSFTGAPGFEIAVPPDHAEALWEALLQAGRPHGITPYGTDAMHVLRAERGFIIVGQETDGTVTADDLGLGGMVALGKGDFVGRRSLARADLGAPGRRQLVGLLSQDPQLVLPEGAQIVAAADDLARLPVAAAAILGHVTSSYHSPVLGRSIALALIADGRSRLDQTVTVTLHHGLATARVVAPRFLDDEGALLHG